MRGEHEAAVERVLTMVDASAAVVAPDERDDLLAEFAEDLRETGLIPGVDGAWDDDADADIADAQVFLGIGLTLLGQIAVKVISVATDLAVEHGVREAASYVVGLVRGDRTEDGADDEDDGAGGGGGDGAGNGGDGGADDGTLAAGAGAGAGVDRAGAGAGPDGPVNAGAPDAIRAPGEPDGMGEPDGTGAATTPTAPATPAAGTTNATTTPPLALDSPTVQAIATAVADRLALPADLDPETLRLIVRVQLAAWARAEGPGPGAR